ncbi:MAG: hypothetical protein EX285_06155 [Thaumarchaeota archaeon]|nr:hypothetical protein [Nitrososphaerota archaeon]
MVIKTRLIGSRIPVNLYTALEDYAGDSKTVGEVFRIALEFFIKHMPTTSTKSAVIRSNTGNTVITDRVQ